MKKNIKHMEIAFNPEWFQSGYYVYVIIITHETKGKFFYVGQTGDRNVKAARSPFYRMMAHYNSYNYRQPNTDAQLVKGLFSKKFNILPQPVKPNNERIIMEEAISNGTLTLIAHFTHIENFEYEKNHNDKLSLVEAIEQLLIDEIRKQHPKNIFNDKNKPGTKIVFSQVAKKKANVIIKKIEL